MFGSCALYQYTEIPSFDSIREAQKYVAKDIEYVEDPLGWKYPEETVYLGYGDCSDKSALFAYILENDFGRTDVKLWVCKLKDTTGLHMIVESGGVYYETTNIKVYPNLDCRYILYSSMSLETYYTIADLLHIN